MKLIFTLIRYFIVALLVAFLFAPAAFAQPNLCANPGRIVYGLTNTGMIYPIDITTGIAGAALNPAYPGNAPSGSNGMGYNVYNGRFYYFKRNPGGSTQEFVSFNPATNNYTMLASCPTTRTVYTGCVNYDGTGFYAMDIDARLFFYNINTGAWTTITTTFFNQFGANITSTLTARSGGDIAIDGLGNLWILCSSASQFGLYKIPGALPVSAQSSITATQVLAPTTATPAGRAFAGIGFNPTGQIFLTTNTGDNRLYRLENNLTLTFLNTLSQNGSGNDLTSCSFPVGVLPIVWTSFTATLIGETRVSLDWGIAASSNEKAFYVEHSTDGVNWNQIAAVAAKANTGTDRNYQFSATLSQAGRQYFRIRQVDQEEKSSYSAIKTVNTAKTATIQVWPNPAKNQLNIQQEKGSAVAVKAQFFDQAGRLVKEASLQAGVNTVSIQSLQTGTYVVRVVNADGSSLQQLIIKQ